MSNINKCPFCGSTDGYYTTATLRHRYFYSFDGEPNGESEPETVYSSKNPRVYCANCNKIIGTYKRLFEKIEGEREMNHDYAHCMNYSKEVCPKECFRAQLTEDLKKRTDLLGLPFTWAHLKGTKECHLKKE